MNGAVVVEESGSGTKGYGCVHLSGFTDWTETRGHARDVRETRNGLGWNKVFGGWECEKSHKDSKVPGKKHFQPPHDEPISTFQTPLSTVPKLRPPL